ncbi:MAG: glycine betaine ABC transporter substrate-binding protein [Dysosmobacter welbionis]
MYETLETIHLYGDGRRHGPLSGRLRRDPSDAGGSGSEAGSGDQKTIVVGTSNFTEVNILGEIYTELIEANTDYEVEQRFGLSGAAMCFDALEQGSIDMFVEYTGTALLNLLAQPMDTDKDRVWQTVHDLMLEDHGIQTSNPWAITTPM